MLCGYLPFEDCDMKKLYKKIIRAHFDLPDFLSDNAKDLLRKILNPNPELRYKLTDIKNHPWFSLVRTNELTEDKEELSFEIINSMMKYGMSPEVTRKHIEMNVHNNIIATYYLLQKKTKRNKSKNIYMENSNDKETTTKLNTKENNDEISKDQMILNLMQDKTEDYGHGIQNKKSILCYKMEPILYKKKNKKITLEAINYNFDTNTHNENLEKNKPEIINSKHNAMPEFPKYISKDTVLPSNYMKETDVMMYKTFDKFKPITRNNLCKVKHHFIVYKNSDGCLNSITDNRCKNNGNINPNIMKTRKYNRRIIRADNKNDSTVD